MDPRLRGDDGQRLFRSAGELLGQHPLLEVVLGIEQQGHRAVARLADHDLHHVAHLVRIGGRADRPLVRIEHRSEEHTSELQSLMRISYAVFCLKKKTYTHNTNTYYIQNTLITS